MSVSCVPPGRTSPYQKGVAPTVKAESSKSSRRHAVVSGEDASERPLKYFHVALVLKRRAACADSPNPSASANTNTDFFTINFVRYRPALCRNNPVTRQKPATL